VAFSGRLGAALGPAPHLSAIRQVLQEAAAAGFEPKLLYQQAVQARASDWPSVPPPEAPGTVRVLPMQLQVGDRMTDAAGEW
jgi:hypothetical protein